MKATLVSAFVLLLSCSICQAQFSDKIDKANSKKFFVGGSFNFDKSENRPFSIFLDDFLVGIGDSNDSSTNKSYNINPKLGYQLNKHWIIGIDLLLTHYKLEISEGLDIIQENTRSGNSIGAFARYIFNPENSFQFWISPYYRILTEESEFVSFNSFLGEISTKDTSNNFGISLGTHYLFTDWVRVTSSIAGYYYQSGTSTSTLTNGQQREIDFSSSGFNFRGSSIYFGVEFLF